MMSPFYMMWDPTYILIVIGMGISLAASAYVQSTYRKYADFHSAKGLTGDDVARYILEYAGIRDVRVQRIRGNLTDNYNPKDKTLNLSETVGPSTSVAAIGVAAHECGHAVQDQVSYLPMTLRSAIVPVVNIGATVSLPLIIAGLFFGQFITNIGILCFALVLVFQVVTLPVEFNASRRALAILKEGELLSNEELGMARHVLIAAALTYVAAVFSTFLQLLRLIILFGDRRD